jgi:hypothetical protein
MRPRSRRLVSLPFRIGVHVTGLFLSSGSIAGLLQRLRSVSVTLFGATVQWRGVADYHRRPACESVCASHRIATCASVGADDVHAPCARVLCSVRGRRVRNWGAVPGCGVLESWWLSA